MRNIRCDVRGETLFFTSKQENLQNFNILLLLRKLREICLSTALQQNSVDHPIYSVHVVYQICKDSYSSLAIVNTPLNLCSVCGGLGLACLDKIHIRHAFRRCVKSDNTLDCRITTLELAFSRRYISKISCVILL